MRSLTTDDRIDADKRSFASAAIRGIRGYILREPERESGQPKFINSERGTEPRIAECGVRSADWDSVGETPTGATETVALPHGLHGLTLIKGLSHRRPSVASVASVVTFCGMREPERESGQPKLINSERGMGAHGTRGGTAKRARNASAYGWSRLGRGPALPAGPRARAGLGHGAFLRPTPYFLLRAETRWEPDPPREQNQ